MSDYRGCQTIKCSLVQSVIYDDCPIEHGQIRENVGLLRCWITKLLLYIPIPNSIQNFPPSSRATYLTFPDLCTFNLPTNPLSFISDRDRHFCDQKERLMTILTEQIETILIKRNFPIYITAKTMENVFPPLVTIATTMPTEHKHTHFPYKN